MDDKPIPNAIRMEMELQKQKINELRSQISDLKSQLVDKDDHVRLLKEQAIDEKKKARIALEKLGSYQKKASSLESRVKSLIQDKNKVFANITQIRIDIYYIDPSNPKDTCRACKLFFDAGYYDKILNFKETFQFRGDFQLMDYACDPSSSQTSRSRYELMSEEALNWYFASGNDIDRYPTLDIFASNKDGKIHRFRFEGIGKFISENEVEITIIPDISLWLISISSAFKKFKPSNLRADGMIHDYLMDKKLLRRL